jgi:excisionase family DNA binding protein
MARSQSPNRELRRSSQPRRGLSRTEAAVYVGISARKFDELVDDGRMPKPKMIDARRIWDIRALDLAFDALPTDGD